MSKAVLDRCQAVVDALPAETLVAAVVHDDDPLILSCLPHPAVIECIHGRASAETVEAAEAWVASRPDVQRRAMILTDRLLADLASYGDIGLPGWVGSHWSAIVRCPWAYGLDDAVSAGEEFFARSA